MLGHFLIMSQESQVNIVELKAIKTTKETLKAVLVETYKYGLIWIPRSCVLEYKNNSFVVNKWFKNKIELEKMGIKDLPKVKIDKDLLDG